VSLGTFNKYGLRIMVQGSAEEVLLYEETTEVTGRTCDCCKAEEGKPRLIGGYIVSLTEVAVDGQNKLVCQSCRIKDDRLRKKLGLPSNHFYMPKTKKSILRLINFK